MSKTQVVVIVAVLFQVLQLLMFGSLWKKVVPILDRYYKLLDAKDKCDYDCAYCDKVDECERRFPIDRNVDKGTDKGIDKDVDDKGAKN